MTTTDESVLTDRLAEALKNHWGYGSFRPLQLEAMLCTASRRDSIVVLPTGGGKSVCFQTPAVIMPGTALVVSPLISLMKDQVDALRQCGIAADRFDSSLSGYEQDEAMARLRAGEIKLLYLSPERLLSDRFIRAAGRLDISFIAIDEGHCVSMWGHDFRPEYRQLGRLKQIFPGLALHVFTATATEPVQQDIAQQLGLENPEVLVGSFDRPNLVYRFRPRRDLMNQVTEIVDRYPGDSGIVYCIRRSDVDGLCEDLCASGYRAAPYHAGLSDHQRKRAQDAFITDEVDIIVATIAFGMGIDKPDVRYVIHTGLPKSLEHYQQESGRAGRDGLPSECQLLFSGADFMVWKHIMSQMPPEPREIAMSKLSDLYAACTGATCRHKALVNYFGQELPEEGPCGACDVCRGEVESMDDALVTAQKVLSCVVRLKQRFGADYTAMVLTGSSENRIIENGHDTLTTYGLLKQFNKRAVRQWIEQLVGQGCLEKWGPYKILVVTDKGWEVLRGEHTPTLLKPPAPRSKAKSKAKKTSRKDQRSWEGVDEALFEKLRALRLELARQGSIPPYMVFGDAALLDMARKKPVDKEGFLEVSGVGESKCKKYAELFLPIIREHDS